MKIIRSWRKTLSVSVKNGEVIVRAPKLLPRFMIDNFVKKHKSRIKKKQKASKESIFDESKIEEYRRNTKKYIVPRVQKLAEKYGFSFNNIRITGARTRWGSCSSKKNLNFSYRLILAPKEVIDYVIIHELSHLKHMNHSPDFWELVENLMPDYKKYEKWLKIHGNSIS